MLTTCYDEVERRVFGRKFVDSMVDLSEHALADKETSDTKKTENEHTGLGRAIQMGWGLYPHPWMRFGAIVVA
jgi:hypothetical protein